MSKSMESYAKKRTASLKSFGKAPDMAKAVQAKEVSKKDKKTELPKRGARAAKHKKKKTPMSMADAMGKKSY